MPPSCMQVPQTFPRCRYMTFAQGCSYDSDEDRLRKACQATLRIGAVSRGDVVAFELSAIEPRAMGIVTHFWSLGSAIMCQIAACSPLGSNQWSTAATTECFVCHSAITSVCIWAEASPNVMKVIPPVQWRLQRSGG